MAFYFFFQTSVTHYDLEAEAGTAVAQGQDVFLRRHYPLDVLPGAATADGQSAEIELVKTLFVSAGACTAEGQRVIMLHSITAGVSTDELRIAAIGEDYRICPIPEDDRNYAIV